MDWMHLCLLILASLSGTFTQENLHGKVFIFPKASKTAYVILKARPEQPLQNFTICLRAATDLTRAHSLFSYAAKTKDNELLLFKRKPGEYALYIGGETATFMVPEKDSSYATTRTGWDHICASWESATGIAEFWVNGYPLARKGLKMGYSITAEPFIVLGQEQDSYGGGFDVSQSFVGEIADVYMWARILSPDEISLVVSNSILSNYLINWRALSYEIKDYVVIKPSLLHVY
uniref:Pentraxin family member n=1 Tax=Sphenodon punctatus TaxID=8508 RepID=A0A8D0L5N0_SPHPU